MPKKSAGLLVYRWINKKVEVFLVHPGGPIWKNRDDGAWSIPKGEFEDGEEALEAAIREFEEETGFNIEGKFEVLQPVKLKGGKVIHSWAVEADLDSGRIKSDTFELEWPSRSGKKQSFPEVDRANWFDLNTARRKLNPGQVAMIDQLEELLER